jgi:5-(carboxyamino)imidazole ribonucleotide synthase
VTTLGIVGGGQLARMLALAARPLDIDCVVLDPGGPACPAAPVARVIQAPYAEADRLVGECDVATVELEHVPVAALEALAAGVLLRPGVGAIAVAQDRLAEKRLCRALGIRTAPFDDEVVASGPAIVKARLGGYDGRRQIYTQTAAERSAALAELAAPIVEGVVAFQRELSIVAARSVEGRIAAYPLVENRHADGMLRETLAPAPGDAPEASAAGIVTRLLDELEYVGVLAVELFDVDGELLVNEIAPRVHNSGHWTIEGAVTSQFEQHVRAVCGLPLGDPSPRGQALMRNLIGEHPPLPVLLAEPGAHVHLYGKEPRPGRKLGHVTVVRSGQPS